MALGSHRPNKTGSAIAGKSDAPYSKAAKKPTSNWRSANRLLHKTTELEWRKSVDRGPKGGDAEVSS